MRPLTRDVAILTLFAGAAWALGAERWSVILVCGALALAVAGVLLVVGARNESEGR